VSTLDDRKATETPDLHAVSTHHCVTQRLQDGRNGGFSVPVCQLAGTVRQEVARGLIDSFAAKDKAIFLRIRPKSAIKSHLGALLERR
jgi:hypothetical protein